MLFLSMMQDSRTEYIQLRQIKAEELSFGGVLNGEHYLSNKLEMLLKCSYLVQAVLEHKISCIRAKNGFANPLTQTLSTAEKVQLRECKKQLQNITNFTLKRGRQPLGPLYSFRNNPTPQLFAVYIVNAPGSTCSNTSSLIRIMHKPVITIINIFYFHSYKHLLLVCCNPLLIASESPFLHLPSS